MPPIVAIAAGVLVAWVVYHVNEQRGYEDRVGWFLVVGLAVTVILLALVGPDTPSEDDEGCSFNDRQMGLC